MNRAKTLVSQTKGVRVLLFKPATELPASSVEGDLIRLPLYCGKHEAFYPAALARETLRTGNNHIFLTGCPCPFGYIIRTEADGAHMKRWGSRTRWKQPVKNGPPCSSPGEVVPQPSGPGLADVELSADRARREPGPPRVAGRTTQPPAPVVGPQL